MGIRLTPRGHLRWEPGEEDVSADLAPFAQSFEVDWRQALFALAAEKTEAQGSPVVRFWRQLADRYLTQLCHLPDDTETIAVEAPSPADFAHWVSTAPPMVGGRQGPPGRAQVADWRRARQLVRWFPTMCRGEAG